MLCGKQYSTVQYSTVQTDSTVQYSTVATMTMSLCHCVTVSLCHCAANNWEPEIMLCGGNSDIYATGGIPGQLNDTHRIRGTTSAGESSQSHPTHSGRWDTMCLDWPTCSKPQSRVMGVMVILTDGSVFIVGRLGGLRRHTERRSERHPHPLLYFPKTKTWYTTPLAKSYVALGYHTSAVLLHNNKVFITGSNPNDGSHLDIELYPSEFRSQFFVPPTLYTGQAQPLITVYPRSIAAGSTFTFCFSRAHLSVHVSKRSLQLSVHVAERWRHASGWCCTIAIRN